MRQTFTVTASGQTPVYSNTGSNLTGWTQIAGTTTYPGSIGSFNPAGGVFVPFTGASSNGSVITTSGYDSVYQLPVNVSGDFTFTCRVLANENQSKVFGPMLFNAGQTQFIWSEIGDYDDSMYQFSTLSNTNTGVVLSGIPSGGPRLTPPGACRPYPGSLVFI